MKKEIFRKVSLDRLSSPEQIDYLIETTSPYAWASLLALFLILGAAAIWGFLGRIDTTVPGQGAIVRRGGVYNIVTKAMGQVTEIHVRVGDMVKTGQVVAHLSQPELMDKLQAAQEELLGAKRAHQRSGDARIKADMATQATVKQQYAAMELQIRNARDQIKLAREQVPVDEQLLAKGLITKQAAIQNLQKIAQLEGEITRAQAQISQIRSDEIAVNNRNDQSSLEYSSRIDGLNWNVRFLEQELKRSSNVTAANSGRVVEIKVTPGTVVGAGSPILSIESAAPKLEAMVYVPASEVKEIKPGMQAQVSPSGVRREEYGYLIGKVDSVGEFPATAEAIVSVFQNETFAKALLNFGPVTEVRVLFIDNPSTVSGLQWSSPKGPPSMVSSGSVCMAQIVTLQQRPIDLVIPYLRNKLGI
jgi:HlyD family secretion protein